ncbi:DUF2004 domain-containing protein [Luteimonas sp. RD2P54]|uniref:DUF2004 domain-containing protein n=1 Tax=Luteimonas endophytica TaxID=3042023 RepID=A0ABT6J4Q9_9GAMM|nr:DUF2004 domain-containing protein [Luteimonas endophytica]MDH5821800.1 DUF2004 domain-containing protein [Luteimonas endophytica]
MADSEIEKRTKLALDAIKKAYGTEEDEFGATLYVKHHLEEIEESYWLEKLGSKKPDPLSVLELLELGSTWGDDDMEHFDFTLPGEITNYVLSVHFADDGEILSIEMES